MWEKEQERMRELHRILKEASEAYYAKDEEIISKTISTIKDALTKTPYSASFGHGMRVGKDDTVEQMLKLAEQEMYIDKELYYKTNNIDRRRR